MIKRLWAKFNDWLNEPGVMELWESYQSQKDVMCLTDIDNWLIAFGWVKVGENLWIDPRYQDADFVESRADAIAILVRRLENEAIKA